MQAVITSQAGRGTIQRIQAKSISQQWEESGNNI